MRTLTDHIVEGDSVNHQLVCLCGCGQSVSGRSHGRAIRFVHGHNGRGQRSHWWNGGVRMAQGYRFLRTEDGRYIQEHILVAEAALGKHLPEGAVIHHVDEDKQHNIGNNLVICQDEAYHQYLHRRTRALRTSGHASWMLCSYCKQYDDPSQMKSVKRREGRHQRAWHEQCRSMRRRELYKSQRMTNATTN